MVPSIVFYKIRDNIEPAVNLYVIFRKGSYAKAYLGSAIREGCASKFTNIQDANEQ